MMRFSKTVLASALAFTALIALLMSSANAQERARLVAKHVPDAVLNGSAPRVGAVDFQQHLRLAINLPLRNQGELTQLLHDIYDPQSPLYHKYLSVQEFTYRFEPTQADYNAVVSWAIANGFTVLGTTPNRRLVVVDGSVITIDRALHVVMTDYRNPTEQRVFYAPDREPTVGGLNVPILQITGLNNYQLPQTMVRRSSLAVASANGAGPSGSYLPSDMRAAYYGYGSLTGAGQSIGIFSLDGYLTSDVHLYYSSAGMSSTVPINNRLVSGFSGACTKVTNPPSSTCDDSEQILDIVNAIGMAPGITQILFYEGPAGSDQEVLNLMATDDVAKVLSSSWSWSPADQASDDPIFERFAAQGQSYLNASGDCGSYLGDCATTADAAYMFPGVDQYITEVGGTDLTTTGPGGTWVAESGWSQSGGGYISGTVIPTWQQLAGVVNSSNGASFTLRNSPDVAAEADADNCTVNNGVFSIGWYGTSFATPRWAGFLALVNQQSVANGKGTVGFLNPALYRLGVSAMYPAAFHDITSGSNPPTGGGNGFYAVAGYDLVTGWGSPKGTGLINQLAGLPSATTLVPMTNLLLQ